MVQQQQTEKGLVTYVPFAGARPDLGAEPHEPWQAGASTGGQE